MKAIENKKFERVKSILKNSTEDKKKILKLNVKDGNYPLYWTISNNNIEIVQLLIGYVNQHQIILEYNKE